MTDKKETETDIGAQMIAVFGLILPLAGFVWGPGPWWHYVLWLLGGVVALLVYMHFEEKREKAA